MSALGIDIGGSAAKLAVVDNYGNILHFRQAVWERMQTAEDILQPLFAALKDILHAAQQDETPVAGLGLSTPGFLNERRTGIIYAANLQMLNGFPLVKALEKETGMYVQMDTDVNAGGLAEAVLGAGKAFKRVLFITIGTGLGGSLLVNREIIRYTNHGVGHLGHIILQPDGALCGCGNRGCVETLVSAQGIIRIADTVLPDFPESVLQDFSRSDKQYEALDIYRAAKDKQDAAAIEILRQEGTWLGLALYNYCALCAPDIIVTGGGVSEAGDYILEPAREVLLERLNPELHGTVEIKQSHFGTNSGVVGDALAILQSTSSSST